MTPSFRVLKLLLCKSVQPRLVLQFKRGEISHDQIKGEVTKDDNISDKKQICVGFLVRSEVISLLVDETITKRYPENFC